MPIEAYRPHEVLVAPVRPHSELWRFFLGLVLAVAVHFFLSILLRAGLYLVLPADTLAEVMSGKGQTAFSLIVLLGSFGLLIVGAMTAVRVMQDRPGRSLIGPLPLAIRQFSAVIRALVLLGVVLAVLPPYGMAVDAPLEPNLPFGRWLVLLPLSVGAVLIQAGAEEILFRGYIQQSLAARFRSPLVWMLVPSVLFAVGHFIPAQAGAHAWLVMAWALIFGILMADLTARAGTLGPAVAVHLVNNATAILLVSVPDSLSGLSLFTLPFSMADTERMQGWLLIDFGIMFVSWLAARLAIRR